MAPAKAGMTREGILYAINHLFLPPQLPQTHDYSQAHVRSLVEFLAQTLQDFEKNSDGAHQSITKEAAHVVLTFSKLHAIGDSQVSVQPEMLATSLRDLCTKGGFMLLQITSQNAGMLITRVANDIHFELFELTPSNGSIYDTKGRLIRTFPGQAIAVPVSSLQKDDVMETLVLAISKMSGQSTALSQPTSKKAGATVGEIRHSVNPCIVTYYLSSILLALGSSVRVQAINKKMREEIMYKSSLIPWTRSPTWLLLRVGFHLTMSRLEAKVDSSAAKLKAPAYKEFTAFLMAALLREALKQDIESDLLTTMTAKVSRRLRKLGANANSWLQEYSSDVIRETNHILEGRWKVICKNDARKPDYASLPTLDFHKDAFASLPDLDKYLETVTQLNLREQSATFSPKYTLNLLDSERLPRISAGANNYHDFQLAAFESWVESSLDHWLQRNLSDPTTCDKLHRLLYDYHTAAQNPYQNNPEATSLMILTCLELWIACNKSALEICTVLGEYHDASVQPSLIRALLQSLILPHKSQLERLQRIESYLDVCSSNSKAAMPSIFDSFGKKNAFYVRHFQSYEEQQRLYGHIELQATNTRRKKEVELANLRSKYSNLKAQADNMSCTFRTFINRRGYEITAHDDRNCSKCKLVGEYQSLQIGVHEWPLPKDPLKAQNAVFELAPTEWFPAWRDATAFLLFKVLSLSYQVESRARQMHVLSEYEGLRHFYSGPASQNITAISQAKSFLSSHYRTIKIGSITSDSQVLVDHALHYEYFNTSARVFGGPATLTDTIPRRCMLKLPVKDLAMQPFLYRPANNSCGPTPNVVIASQHECPQHMTLAEFRELCALPLGFKLQWQNMLRQLHAPSVDFNQLSTFVFHAQCITQAGPPFADNVLRASHAILSDPVFSRTLLDGVVTATSRVAESWQSVEALRTFILIATRTLQLTTDPITVPQCVEYLASARNTVLGWAISLRDKARASTDTRIRNNFRHRAARCALICSMSFDMDQGHISSALQSSVAASQFLQCSLIAREGTDSESGSDSHDGLTWQWKRLSHRAFRILSDCITGGSRALDDAISSSWSGHRAQKNWAPVSSQYPEWLVGSACEMGAPVVRFNLLTGELLVNGLPLNRLPSDYESHSTYRTLFGRSIVEVMPKGSHGFPFSTNVPFAGYDVEFALNSGELYVRATKGDRVLYYVPSRLLSGSYPEAFINDYVHFYDETTQTVSLRPLKKPWDVPRQPWTLSHEAAGGRWQLCKDNMTVISLRTPTSKTLANILGTLEKEARIHCVLSANHRRLDIELPVLRSRFSLEAGDTAVSCRDFRGMVVDEDQQIGTLVGLFNKLVLKSTSSSSDRIVLVPNGTPQVKRTPAHVSLQITEGPSTCLYAYRVDTLLGRLVDGGDLQSKLFLCLLHALTSFCMPDRLTSRTGTEEALRILQSAAVQSANGLKQMSISLLTMIADLTPKREFYPQHLRVMQTMYFDNKIGMLAQHDGFVEQAQALLDQATNNKFFHESHPETASVDLYSGIDRGLLARHKIRVAQFRVSTFGAEDHDTAHDLVYKARDVVQDSAIATATYAVADTLHTIRVNPHVAVVSDLVMHIWRFLEKLPVANGSADLDTRELAYDAKWFMPWSTATKPFIVKNWLKLHRLLSQPATKKKWLTLTTWLASLSCAEEADETIVHVLTTFSTCSSRMSQVTLPTSSTQFALSRGRAFKREDVLQTVRDRKRSFDPLKDIIETRREYESLQDFHNRGRTAWQTRAEKVAQDLTTHFGDQWPCAVPAAPTGTALADAEKYFQWGPSVMSEVSGLFRLWFENLKFFQYLQQICAIVSRDKCTVVKPVRPALKILPTLPHGSRGYVSPTDLFDRSTPPRLTPAPSSLPETLSVSSRANNSVVTLARSRLRILTGSLQAMAQSKYENSYIANLESSLAALEQGQFLQKALAADFFKMRGILESHLAACQNHVDSLYDRMTQAMTNDVADTYQLPRLSPVLLLERLNRKHWASLSEDWKKILIEYGVGLTRLQRAQRLLRARGAALVKELQNDGHANWDPAEHPEWLLLEIEGSILIRGVQVDIATHMQSPAHGKNAVMQLNMGEGKSSVIVPMLVTSLADGNNLMRVIVAKPQSKQMVHMLVSKLGGLVDRQVFHLPFSRAIKVGQPEINAIKELLSRCRDQGGVLLVQPEHILSFQLMGIEHKISQKHRTSDQLLQLHDFMRRHSRDVVDESDENFSPKFELVYSLGLQQPIDHSPERWTCIQEVLDVVRKCLPAIQQQFPHGTDIRFGSLGCFPRTRLIEPKAVDKLLDIVADDVCRYGLMGFPIAQATQQLRRAVREYIRNPDASAETIALVERAPPVGFWAETTKNTLLLLRGLIANGILAFAFGHKRWRVDYGLDITRSPPTRLAVPYRAKDHPSARSEFSHPDVVIVLTSLSYYYQGLTNEQLGNALSHLDRSDQRADEYATWVKDADNLPGALEHLGGVNLEDPDLCSNRLFPCFRHSKAAVDYFLAHVVFTKEMKEFPHRLSASGWDIGEQKPHPTTGFSGTNDAQIVLPLSVTQTALPAQAHTNALVLQHLLQAENNVMAIQSLQPSTSDPTSSTPGHSPASTSAEQLLQMVVGMEPPVRVILDVGTQIIELDNLGVAQRWLTLLANDSGTEAAVFVDKQDNICVVDRKGRVEPLHTSPYCTQLSLCVVFLDDAHTRGTDLKLPEDYRAAVTLGANLVKDRLVQACMRMRELGRDQSVVFCVPEEIHRKINRLMGRTNPVQQVSVADVLAWSISETWHDARRNTALWANQGRRHESHSLLWAQARGEGATGPVLHRQQSRDLDFPDELAKGFLEDEAQLLETRYRPTSQQDTATCSQIALSKTERLISQRCQDLDTMGPSSAILQEEQERELAPEVEEERQLERPDKAEPLKHAVHPHVEAFVKTGSFPANSAATFIPVYDSLADSSAAKYIAKLRRSGRTGRVHCTRDFQATIKPPAVGYVSDSYQRPVQWILTSSSASASSSRALKHMVIISPYEAQSLMDTIKQSRAVTLHLYAPLLNEGFRSLDRLDLYTVPSPTPSLISASPSSSALLAPGSATPPLPHHAPPLDVDVPADVVLELDLFAGQLYFKTFAEFEALREYLLARPPLACPSVGSDGGGVDGQAIVANGEPVAVARVLDEHLVGLLNVVMMKMRRNCETIDKTHTGKALDCRLIAKDEFQE
ncbi:uncharacterized protein B0I36DRAFT_416058 [Microdochium trichocladiopsis]|uniref:ubiquitinyl hydrolase 1 n=1 Tax=Microdochium trichocladiopsis TaxID=1682393 RepID=A0A9P8XYU4_9PEZI|nr:uncharacterized protein B0I36DRAFT_416058 [Microdochium trichocladiopsis]KAH7024585.1 hypothetical protein B0I36DRAFT_416058 [Microdochium trichocladiopsis]